MSQRQVLENAINRLNRLRGPAKLFYAPYTLGFPTIIQQVLNVTQGGAASGWTAFGITRGGVNVTKTLDTNVLSDADQILGAYAQDITDRSYRLSTQVFEVLDQVQRGVAMEEGTPTVVGASANATQVMTPLDSNVNTMTARHWAVVYPKPVEGKVYAFVFRWGELASGDDVVRFDKTDPASPALDLIFFPDIATTIDSGDQWGREFEIT